MGKNHKRERASAGRGHRQESGEILFIFYFPSLRFFLRSTKIGPQVFIETEGKVDPRNKGYAWKSKYWIFVKLHEVGNFPTCLISR